MPHVFCKCNICSMYSGLVIDQARKDGFRFRNVHETNYTGQPVIQEGSTSRKHSEERSKGSEEKAKESDIVEVIKVG